jgi:uncharacterized membrane protein (DUF4010 family)
MHFWPSSQLASPLMSSEHVIIRLAVALGIGLLIGIERERSKGQGPQREVAGVRTFTLISVMGALSLMLGEAWGLLAFSLILGGIVALSYHYSREHDPGLTTEVAMLLTVLLGGLAMRQPGLAAGLAVVVTIILAARSRLHDWIHNVLTDQEVRDGLMLAAAALVVLPVIPSEPVDPWGIVDLRKLWTLAVLIMAINGLGYISLRVLGPKAGLALAGLFSGFVSSTATIGAMGARTRKEPHLHRGAVAGAAVSSVATVLQLAIVVSLVSPSTFAKLIFPLIASGLAALLYAGLFTWRSVRDTTQDTSPPGRPFHPKTAIMFVAVVGVTLLVSALLTQWLGDRGMLLATGVAGFSDAHAAAISAASLAAGERVTAAFAAMAILVGFSTNTVSKIIVAFGMGNRRFALELVPGLLLMVMAAWAGWLATHVLQAD